jgi:hypothetical protein
LNVHGVNDFMQMEMHAAEPLDPDSAFLGWYCCCKVIQSIEHIPAEPIQARCNTLRYEIYKLINSVWKKEELPQQWRGYFIVPIYKKGDKTDCSSYTGMSLLQATSKILSSVVLSRLTPCVDKITGDHECGFQYNRSTTDQIFCIRQILD